MPKIGEKTKQPQPTSEELFNRAVQAGSEMLLRQERYGNRLDWLYEGLVYGITATVKTALECRRINEANESEQLQRMQSSSVESTPSNRWEEHGNPFGIVVETSDTSNRIKIFGVGESDFLRWLGHQGWGEEEVQMFYDNLDLRHPNPQTMRTCLATGGSKEQENPYNPERTLAIEKCGGRIVEEQDDRCE